MSYMNFEPDKRLQDHIKCFWYAERKFGPGEAFTILPDSFIELVLCFSESGVFYIKRDGLKPLPPAFIVGLLDRGFDITAAGLVRTFGIRFYPWTYYQLINKAPGTGVQPVPELFNRLHEQIGTLNPGGEIGRCMKLLEDTCMDLVGQSTMEENKVVKASRLINENDGRIRIDSVAEGVFSSPRQLDRLFRSQIGESPKSYARKVRFEKVRDRLFENPGKNLTELAYAFGFSDQAHFIADFKAFAGQSPGKFARDMRRLKSMLERYNQQL